LYFSSKKRHDMFLFVIKVLKKCQSKGETMHSGSAFEVQS
jgi:hypothetical protein